MPPDMQPTQPHKKYGLGRWRNPSNNLPGGLAAGEDPAAGSSLPIPFLKSDMPEALARLQ